MTWDHKILILLEEKDKNTKLNTENLGKKYQTHENNKENLGSIILYIDGKCHGTTLERRKE